MTGWSWFCSMEVTTHRIVLPLTWTASLPMRTASLSSAVFPELTSMSIQVTMAGYRMGRMPWRCTLATRLTSQMTRRSRLTTCWMRSSTTRMTVTTRVYWSCSTQGRPRSTKMVQVIRTITPTSAVLTVGVARLTPIPTPSLLQPQVGRIASCPPRHAAIPSRLSIPSRVVALPVIWTVIWFPPKAS